MFSRSNLRYDPVPLPDQISVDDATALDQANAFLHRMRLRHTVRDFSDRPVPRQLVETAIQTAGTAPSGANHQPWFFAAISDAALKSRIRKAAEAEEQSFYDGRAGEE